MHEIDADVLEGIIADLGQSQEAIAQAAELSAQIRIVAKTDAERRDLSVRLDRMLLASAAKTTLARREIESLLAKAGSAPVPS